MKHSPVGENGTLNHRTLMLARIVIYPIKSLDGVELPAACFNEAGLADDRRFAIVDEHGGVVNGKRTAAVHAIRAEYELSAGVVRLRGAEESAWRTFALWAEPGDRQPLERWLCERLGLTVTLIENRPTGFPDDPAASGPTVISTPTLAEVARWFELSLDETRRRFRANLEIDAESPFWEDQLFSSDVRGLPFRIGEVSFLGVNPCARCVVPSRSTENGRPTPQFQKIFAQRRAASLPPWAPADRFDHFYRLAVNTRVVTPAPGAVRVGDAVCIAESRPEQKSP
jgi:uncharacterized protein